MKTLLFVVVLVSLASSGLSQVVVFPAGAITVSTVGNVTTFSNRSLDVRESALSILAYGDSKTSLGGWQPTLLSLIRTAEPSVSRNVETLAESGMTVASMRARVDADIAALSIGKVGVLLFNLGANDVSQGLPAEATWEANVEYILDAFRVHSPNVHVYIMRPWFRTGLAGCNTIAGWIDVVVASRVAWVSVGPDERVWLEGGDDGATMTYDGVHYSTAGNTECAAQWKTVLGY